MIWQNAWAFAGLLLLALPVLIHLLSRKRAVLQKFPSLRFLDVTRLLPTRSPNLSDIPLLLVRLGIIATAVIALAQPLYVSAMRKQSLNASLARAIVVDTSRSMMRVAGGTKTIADSARTLAQQLAGEASTSITLQSENVSDALPGAEAWLEAQPGRAEVVVISDFQVGALDSVTVANVPAHIGFRAVQLAGSAVLSTDAVLRTSHTSVTAKASGSRTDAEWTEHNSNDPGITLVQLFAMVADMPGIRAISEAAQRITSPGLADSLRPVGIVFPGATEQAAFTSRAKAPTKPWMATALSAVRDNELLASSAALEQVRDSAIATPFAVLARNNAGAPVVYAAQTEVNGATQLIFFNRGAISGMKSAALIAAVSAAVAQPLNVAETETAMLSPIAIKQFQRAPQDVSAQGSSSQQKASANAGLSDGRWLWLLVLALLGVETWMRRSANARDAISTNGTLEAA